MTKSEPLKGVWFATYGQCFESRDTRRFRALEEDLMGDMFIDMLRAGVELPAGTSGQDVSNTLTRLRRQGRIVNKGSRTRPNWALVTSTEDLVSTSIFA